jgi:hypothetical protein
MDNVLARRVLTAGAGAAAIGLFLAAPAGAADLPDPKVSTSGGQSVMTFLSHTTDETYTPKGGKPTKGDPQQRPGVGDTFGFVDENSQDGTKIGTDSGACTIVKASEKSSTAHCLVTLTFGNGTIAVEGDAEFSENSAPFTVPITGGTGAYAGATGSAKVVEVNDADSNLTVTYSTGKGGETGGQVATAPVGGAETGGGSTAGSDDPLLVALGAVGIAAGVVLLGAAGRAHRRSV